MTASEDILCRVQPAADARLPYGDGPLQFGDLRVPGGDGPHPLAIVIHGGYWRARYGLEYFGVACEALRGVGIATWNVEYRRLGNDGGGWPGTFLDVARATDAVRDLVAGYRLDMDRVVALGHSAGGQLALWLAGRRRIAAASTLAAPDPLSLRGAISLAGVCDLREAWERQLSNTVVRDLLGGAPEAVPERYDVASPASLLPLGVPQWVVHGTADESVPYAISERYAARARAAGDDVTFVRLEGVGHFEVVDPETSVWGQVQEVIEEALAQS